jgi:hypothetical protein
MAYGVVHQFPGGTKKQYEASIEAVHPSDGSLPEGQTFHAAGPSADGWTVIAIHESQESWARFRNETARHEHDRPETSPGQRPDKRHHCLSWQRPQTLSTKFDADEFWDRHLGWQLTQPRSRQNRRG